MSLRLPSALRLTGLTALLCSVAMLTLAGCSSAATPTVPAPGASLSAASLSFPSTIVGTSGGTQVITLTNSGTATLSGIAATLSGSTSYTDTTTCTSTLAPAATCTISVLFQPSTTGSLTATLSVADNALGSPQSVAITGTGTAPIATLAPTSVSFPATTVTTSGGTQIVTLTNTGTAILSGIGITIGGSSAFTETTSCGSTLAPTATCNISVSFVPPGSTSFTGTLTVADSAAGSPQTVALTGSGTAISTSCAAYVPPVTSTSVAGIAMKVKVLAGIQPVVGSSVQLYAAGSTGLGSAPTALLTSALVTDATGSVSIPATYTFPSATSQVYLVARGGTVASASSANSALTLLTALGTGNQIVANSTFTVNEVTTVAATYTLAQFMQAGGVIGASSTNITGLTNAFANAASLACASAGVSPGVTFPANGVSPASRIDSLANLLNSCTSAVAANSCSQLFTYATVNGSAAPANTLDALLNIARNPGVNIQQIYTLSSSSTVFPSPLTSAPKDWTLFVTFSGSGMNSPSGIGVDSKGNIRVANYFNVASAFSPIGNSLFPNGITGSGLDNSYGLAVDASDNAWIPNEQSPYAVNTGLGSVSVFNIAGASVAGTTGYAAGGFDYPISIAIDPNTTAWVVDYGNSHLTLVNSTGTPLSGTTGYTTSLFAFPVAVAVDGNHFGWVANQSSNTVTKVAPDGSSFVNYTCCNGASGIAVDQNNNVWVANYYGQSVSQIGSTGMIISNQGYTAGGSIDHPQGIAVDGSGHIWVINYRQPYITELQGSAATTPGAAISPVTGYGADAALLEAYAVAIDASGNIWVTNFGSSTVTQFLGLATPVKTPLLGLPQLP